MKTNSVIMSEAKDALKGKWGLAIGVYLIYIIITYILSFLTLIPIVGFILYSVLLAPPLGLGLVYFAISLSRKNKPNVKQLFGGFKDFSRVVVLNLLIFIFVFLWSLLFIIPGIIAAMSYSLSMYIIADDKKIKAKDAITKSKEMMYGHKGQLFVLGIMFFGLSILCVFTLGIGFIWLLPYMQVTMAKFYDGVKESNVKEIKVKKTKA